MVMGVLLSEDGIAYRSDHKNINKKNMPKNEKLWFAKGHFETCDELSPTNDSCHSAVYALEQIECEMNNYPKFREYRFFNSLTTATMNDVIPFKTLYKHYLKFCKSEVEQPKSSHVKPLTFKKFVTNLNELNLNWYADECTINSTEFYGHLI